MTKAIDETWTAEGGVVYFNEHESINIGRHVRQAGNVLGKTAKEAVDDDDARARLASVAPEALRLLLSREWGRHNQCFECGGISFVPAERSLYQGHKSSCAWVALMKRAGVR